MRYTKLTSVNGRRLFDPTLKSDLLELKYYMDNGKWKQGCPFYQEHPWEDIPAMCKDKYTAHQLAKLK
jgi:hypothetical protein